MYYMIGLAAFFIISEIMVAKKMVPAWLTNISAGKTIWRSILILGGVAVIGIVFKMAIPLTILATIYLATVISNKYLTIFSKMEAGKKIWPNGL